MWDWRRWKKYLEENLLEDWQYKLGALGAAVALWGYVAGQQSVQAVYSIPIYFQNLPPKTEIVGPKIYQVEVRVAGRRDRMQLLRDRPIWIGVDLSGMRPGINRCVLSPEQVSVPSGLEVKDLKPRKLAIQLSTVESPKQ